MFACVLACATAAARVLMRMAKDRLMPAGLERTSRRHGTPGAGIILSTALMFAVVSIMTQEGVTGYSIYDLLGSMAVLGFLTAYALVALSLPFARRALGQHSYAVVAISLLTIVVILLIGLYDLRSAPDAIHGRIPYLYLAYIAAGLAWFWVRHRKAATP
jgi:amino acid transporter